MFFLRRIVLHVLIVFVLVQSSFFLPGIASPAPAAPLALSPSDRTLLGRGQIVFKTELPQAPGAPVGNGGTAVALLQADPEEVWRILTDFAHYAGLFPRLKESEMMEQAGGRALVRFRVAVGPFSFRFFVTHIVSWAERRIRWQLDRSQSNDLFRDTWGYWQLDPAGSDSVLVTYAMGSRTFLPSRLTRGSERDSVVETLAALKTRVEHTPARPEGR